MTVRSYTRTLTLASPFVISRGTRRSVTNLFLDIGDGSGEGAPIYYRGQTPETLLRAARDTESLVAVHAGDLFDTMAAARATHPHQSGWLCALDLALHDRWGKAQGKPLWQLIHGNRDNMPPTSFTISLGEPEQMLAQARAASAYPVLKVKCGGPQDLAALRLLAQEDGRPLRVDANEGWTAETTRDMLRVLPDLGVELLEQPVPADRISLLRAIVPDSPIPIVLDESIHTGLDIHLALRCCHGVNIKLAKCGGILEALRMIGLARHYGLRTMLGCMIESSLAVAAAAHLAPLVDWIDLDAPLLLADDPYAGLHFDGGQIALPTLPGIGVLARF